MIPKKPVPELDPGVETGFPHSRSTLRRAQEDRKRSYAGKMSGQGSNLTEPIKL
jgi:hypothetical protein